LFELFDVFIKVSKALRSLNIVVVPAFSSFQRLDYISKITLSPSLFLIVLNELLRSKDIRVGDIRIVLGPDLLPLIGFLLVEY
jgi:hypothetical protein